MRVFKRSLFLAATISAMPFAAHGQTITSPYVNKGEVAAEVKGRYRIDDDNEIDNSWQTEASISYGVTDFWQVKAGGIGEHSDFGDETDLSAAVIETKFQLAPEGRFFADPGLKLEYEHSLLGQADEIEAKFILARQFGKFGNVMNISAGREMGEKSADDWGYGFSYGIVYEYSETFQYGLEWYSDFGDFEDDFKQQEHQVGPVAYGAIGNSGFAYEAGVLFGVTDSSPDAQLKAVVEYELEF